MFRILGSLALLALVSFGLWPYYTMFRLDGALGHTNAQTLAPYVDLPAIQARYKARLGHTVQQWLPNDTGAGENMRDTLAGHLSALGGAALEQALTLERVRELLRDAVARAGGTPNAGLIEATDFAFFESWDRFTIRLGKLGEGPTHVILALAKQRWQIVDIVR